MCAYEDTSYSQQKLSCMQRDIKITAKSSSHHTIIYLSVLGHKIANTNHHNNNQIKRKEPLKLNCYKNDTNKSNNHRQSQILAGGEKLKRVYPPHPMLSISISTRNKLLDLRCRRCGRFRLIKLKVGEGLLW